MKPEPQTLVIPADCHGLRLDQTLAKLFPEYSRSKLSQWLKAGLIKVNGQQLAPKDKTLAGAALSFSLPEASAESALEAEAIPIAIAYEDEDLLIVDKAAGLVVHPGAGNPNATLVNALLHHEPRLQELPRAGIIHRLDKDTSGLLLVGKTWEAYTALVRQMQAREIHRHYWALVYGHLIAGQRIETCFGRHPQNRLKMAVRPDGREAITEFSLAKQYQFASLLDVQLYTGRTHQIRVHLAHIKHPIIGDPLYGGRSRLPAGLSASLREALMAFPRQALHAYYLGLEHPISGAELELTSPIPEDLQQLIDAIEDFCE